MLVGWHGDVRISLGDGKDELCDDRRGLATTYKARS